MCNKKLRDLEKEREEFLKQLKEHIPNEVLQRIDYVASLQPSAETPSIKISNKGAADAD